LAAAVGWAATHHRNAAAVGISTALHEHLRIHGPWTLALDLHHAALAAARDANDQPGQALTLTTLADTQRLTGDYPAAATTAPPPPARPGPAPAPTPLRTRQRLPGHSPPAATPAGPALDLCRQPGDRHGQANALHTLSHVQYRTGDLAAAATTARQALDLSRQL